MPSQWCCIAMDFWLFFGLHYSSLSTLIYSSPFPQTHKCVMHTCTCTYTHITRKAQKKHLHVSMHSLTHTDMPNAQTSEHFYRPFKSHYPDLQNMYQLVLRYTHLPQTSPSTCTTSTSNTRVVFLNLWFEHESMSSVFIQFCIEKRSTHSKCVGVFTPTSLNLSKHPGFQTTQSRAKETRQTGSGVMLFQQRMSDLKGKRGFVGNLHTRDLSHFWVACGLQAANPLALDGPSYLCLMTFIHIYSFSVFQI